MGEVQRLGDVERQELEAALMARVDAIFERCASLCGFSIAERLVPPPEGAQSVREWELYVAAVSAYPEPGEEASAAFIGEISGALEDLLNHRPQAADLLPGRTFARVWH
jgi:hypothetical protein